MSGIDFQPSASACMNSGLYGEGDVRPTHDHATTCYSLPSTPRTGFVPGTAAGHWMRVNAGHRFLAPFRPVDALNRRQQPRKPLCAARGVVNGTLLVVMPVS